MKIIFVFFGIFISIQGFCQDITHVFDVEPDKNYDNVLIKKLYSDTHATTFVIWIKKEVKAHKHLVHTEQVLVLEGKAKVKLNDKVYTIQKGDWITIPKQTVHQVEVLSKIPLKVISIQTPRFEGKDRVFIE